MGLCFSQTKFEQIEMGRKKPLYALFPIYSIESFLLVVFFFAYSATFGQGQTGPLMDARVPSQNSSSVDFI